MSNQQRAHIRESTVSRTNTKRTKKRVSGLDKYVIFSLACLILFTAVMIPVQAITGTTQDTLITCFFAAFGGEVLACAMIKKFKLKNGDTEI